MSRLLQGLNPQQREAVTTLRGPVLILAGAGTGKTKVITHRMAHLIAEGVEPRHILALTFTNKAAREMKERYQKLVQGMRPPEETRLLFAGTFHSFCVRVLREHIEKLDYKKNFTILDEGDQAGILKKILGAAVKGGDQEMNKIKFLIGLAKNRGLRPEQTAGSDALLARVYRRYQEECKARNAVDFDDLLLLMVDLLEGFPEVRGELRARHRFLMVDEYQDTNRLQFDIVRQLASDDHDVCVVGDDDQSIYSWRGAENSHIMEFSQRFPGGKSIKLEQNYRCTPRILAAANQVIAHNARRHDKKLWAEGLPGDPIRVMLAQNDEDEASWVAADILRAREEHVLRWEDMALLYRANHMSRLFEMELRKLRIPYRIIGGQNFYERREVKDILAYLQVIANPDNDGALLRVVNLPARGVGTTTMEELTRRSREAGSSIWRVMQGDLSLVFPRAYPGLTSFRTIIHEYQGKFALPGDWAGVLKALLKDIGYEEDLKRTSKDPEEHASRSENVQGLVNALAEHQAKELGDLNAFIDTMLLDSADKEEEKEDDGYGVTLMTLHGAKGLEFTRVYLVGVEEGLLPHDRVKLEGNLEEERRLFYVGITRAKKWLTLTRCQSRRRYGKEEPRHPSVFLDELPEEGVEHQTTASTRVKVEGEVASSRLSALRARLGAAPAET
ncbi:MAG: UvrD-helicase domain-containing protein [Candidatus Methylacidiphilales bacterium]|nr:UvrD-helicase domain-containing protein [Candidatus Methylacidiphilales bacterium]